MSRRSKTLEVPPHRRLGAGPLDLLVDSTGLKLGGAGEWLVEGTSRRRSWRKLHVGIDGESGEIVAIELTKKESDDGALLDQLTDPVASLTADAAYDQDRVYETIAERSDAASSCRCEQPQFRVRPPRPLRHSGTDISRRSSRTVGWAGKSRAAIIGGPKPRPRLVDTNA